MNNSQIKIIEPSLLAFYKDEDLVLKLRELKQLGITRIHYDVMDNTYVPNFSFTTEYINLLKENGFEVEVHLMVRDVKKYYEMFLPYQPNAILFHPSVLNDEQIKNIIESANNDGINIGFAINTSEDYNHYLKFIKDTNIILFMGVPAGFGGQAINEIGIQHLHSFKKYAFNNNLNIDIVFDGGINNKTISLIYNDANYIVSGSYLMKSENKKEAIDKLLMK